MNPFRFNLSVAINTVFLKDVPESEKAKLIHRGVSAECPHCGVVVQFVDSESRRLGHLDTHYHHEDGCSFAGDSVLHLWWTKCPSCRSIVVQSCQANKIKTLIPMGCSRAKKFHHVPAQHLADLDEAYLILDLSPRSSAAIARRCLEAILEDQGFKSEKLVHKIEAAVPKLPPYVSEYLEPVRKLGNIAAHPNVNQITGEIKGISEQSRNRRT